MRMKKYGIWKKRFAYNSRKMFEGWLTDLGKPLLFREKKLALDYKRTLEMSFQDNSIELEAREYK